MPTASRPRFAARLAAVLKNNKFEAAAQDLPNADSAKALAAVRRRQADLRGAGRTDAKGAVPGPRAGILPNMTVLLLLSGHSRFARHDCEGQGIAREPDQRKIVVGYVVREPNRAAP